MKVVQARAFVNFSIREIQNKFSYAFQTPETAVYLVVPQCCKHKEYFLLVVDEVKWVGELSSRDTIKRLFV